MVLTDAKSRCVGMKQARIGQQPHFRGFGRVDDIFVLGKASIVRTGRDQQQPVDPLKSLDQRLGLRIVGDADFDTLGDKLLGDLMIGDRTPATIRPGGIRLSNSPITRRPSSPVEPVTNSRDWPDPVTSISLAAMFRTAQRCGA